MASLLPSTDSAAAALALFAGFVGTTRLSDFRWSFISGYRASRPAPLRPRDHLPGRPADIPVLAHGGSRHARGLRPRRVDRHLACLACGRVAFRLGGTASALRTWAISRLNTLPACAPTDASPSPLRVPAHGLGPPWVASPSAYGSCIHSSMPVYPGAHPRRPRSHRIAPASRPAQGSSTPVFSPCFFRFASTSSKASKK